VLQTILSPKALDQKQHTVSVI